MPINSNKNNPRGNNPKGGRNPRFPIWIYVVLLLTLLAIQFYFISPQNPNHIPYSQFLTYVKKGYVKSITIKNNVQIQGKYTDEAVSKGEVKVQKPQQTIWDVEKSASTNSFTTTMLKGDDIRPILDAHNVKYDVQVDDNWFGGMLVWVIPIGLAILFWIFIFKRMNPGQQVLSIGKNRASLYDKQSENKVTFKDVAGLNEAKEEVAEVVEFLKNPQKFTKLGGNIPKGVLLVGPPGTGKTLLAKATAGEADVPFFSLSGSDFVEMFVGVGAARVRDLFKQAKEKAPCIIFIDEIDAIGRSRGKGVMMGSNDERENTLNQLLSEMDGFNTEKGVIIMAATNRPDVLDSALMRPGRFDRQILIDKPDLNGRVEVLQVHTRRLKIAEDVDLRLLASQTPGFAGAELANMCNEAALLAARRNKNKIQMIDFQDAIERVVAGLEKKNKLISANERKIVAYHESGHAIVSWFLEHTDPVLKVSIVPRGLAALGYTLQTPLEDRFLMTKEELIDKICALLGGRVAEEIIFGRISTGAQNDLERITNMSFAMVAVYGMSEDLGYISYLDSQNPDSSFGFNKKYSEITAEKIDQAVHRIVNECHDRTKQILTDHRDKLEEMAQTLLKKEILNAHDLLELLGERPYGNYPISLDDARQLDKIKNGTTGKDGKKAAEEIKGNGEEKKADKLISGKAKDTEKAKPEAGKQEKNNTSPKKDIVPSEESSDNT